MTSGPEPTGTPAALPDRKKSRTGLIIGVVVAVVAVAIGATVEKLSRPVDQDLFGSGATLTSSLPCWRRGRWPVASLWVGRCTGCR